MFVTSREMLERIKVASVDLTILRAFGTLDSLLDNQGAYWSDDKLTGGDLIAFYNDLVEHEESFPVPTGIDEETGEPIIEQITMPVRTLDQLRIIAPEHAEELDRQYNREVAKLLESA